MTVIKAKWTIYLGDNSCDKDLRKKARIDMKCDHDDDAEEMLFKRFSKYKILKPVEFLNENLNQWFKKLLFPTFPLNSIIHYKETI